MFSKLKLLSNPSIETIDGNQLIPADKRGALLIYLANKEDWVQRELISFLFWPDKDDKTAKRNLRQLISRCKKLSFAEDIEVDAGHLRWVISIDTTAFKKAIAEQNWQEAIALYQGGFCEAYTVTDANGFQDWVQLEREAYTSAFAGAVRQHADVLLKQGNYEQAATSLKRILEQDDLAEDMLQRYLQAAYLDGQKDNALIMYKQFKERLKTELDLEPLTQTQEIVKTIEKSQEVFLPSASTNKAKTQQIVPLSIMRPPKLVGRQETIDAISKSSATLVVLIGEAGIGKTRLLAELAPKAILIKAEESLHNVPFHAIAEVIKKQKKHPLKQLGMYSHDLVRLIPEVNPSLKPGPTEAFTAKQRLFEALARYFEAITTSAPSNGFAIAFDDIQWLDENSLEFLAFLHNRNSLKLIATSRKFEMSKQLSELLKSLSDIETIHLETLQLDDIQTLLAELMDKKEKPVLFAQWLHKNTSGNIMFVLETLKSLFESGDLRADHDGWHSNLDDVTNDYSELVIPKLVSDLIQRRIEPLSEEVKRVLQGAAVISSNFNEKILSQITGLSQWSILEAIEVGQAVGVLDDNSFKHDLLRQSIYTNINSNKLSFLHAQVAQTLDSDNPTKTSKEYLLIGQHWIDAAEDEKAARAIREAVHQQRAIGLQAEAIKNLERCMNFDLEIELKHEISYLLCVLQLELGSLDKATTLLNTLLEETQDSELQAKIMCTQLTIGIRQGQNKQVENTFSRLKELESKVELPIEVKQEIFSNKAVIAHYEGNYDQAIALQLQSNELCKQQGNDLRLALGLSSLGAVYDYSGRYEEALSLFNESLELSQSLNALYLQQEAALNIVSCYADIGRHNEAIDIGLEALKLGRYDATDFLRNNIAAAYLEIKQNEQAIDQFETLINETENNTLKCNAWGYLIALYAEQDQKAKQDVAIEQAFELVKITESPPAISRVVISCLTHGDAPTQATAQTLAEDLDMDSIPPIARAQLKEILQK